MRHLTLHSPLAFFGARRRDVRGDLPRRLAPCSRASCHTCSCPDPGSRSTQDAVSWVRQEMGTGTLALSPIHYEDNVDN